MATTEKPAWLSSLEKDGYVVVPKLVSTEDCADFREQALQWLEKFPHGFKRADRSTWTSENLPYGVTGGLYNRYSVTHEDFVWKIRTQPKILEAFETIWGTPDLIVSFDGMNVTFPVNEEYGRTDIKPTGAWPHIDQDTSKIDRFEMYQGIANLAPNGPDDGGLCVMSGSHVLHNKYFAENGGINPDQAVVNGYNYTFKQGEWFKANGCREVKICAGEGDLIIWDSRTIHWNSSPIGNQTRFATYICYCPRSMADEEGLKRKLEIFHTRKGTTHWPNDNKIPAERPNYHNALPRRPDDTVDPANRDRPFVEPEDTEAVMRLVGVRS